MLPKLDFFLCVSANQVRILVCAEITDFLPGDDLSYSKKQDFLCSRESNELDVDVDLFSTCV